MPATEWNMYSEIRPVTQSVESYAQVDHAIMLQYCAMYSRASFANLFTKLPTFTAIHGKFVVQGIYTCRHIYADTS